MRICLAANDPVRISDRFFWVVQKWWLSYENGGFGTPTNPKMVVFPTENDRLGGGDWGVPFI